MIKDLSQMVNLSWKYQSLLRYRGKQKVCHALLVIIFILNKKLYFKLIKLIKDMCPLVILKYGQFKNIILENTRVQS